MSKSSPLFEKILWVLSALCGAAAGLLAVRFLFRLLLANPSNPATPVVYTITRPLLIPWDRIWPPGDLPIVTVERATLVALAFYVAIGLALAFWKWAIRGRGSAHGHSRPEEET